MSVPAALSHPLLAKGQQLPLRRRHLGPRCRGRSMLLLALQCRQRDLARGLSRGPLQGLLHGQRRGQRRDLRRGLRRGLLPVLSRWDFLLMLMLSGARLVYADAEGVQPMPVAPVTLASQRLFFSPAERQAQAETARRLLDSATDAHRDGNEPNSQQSALQAIPPVEAAELAEPVAGSGTERASSAWQDAQQGIPITISASASSSSNAQPHAVTRDVSSVSLSARQNPAADALSGAVPTSPSAAAHNAAARSTARVMFDALIRHAGGERVLVNGLPCRSSAVVDFDRQAPVPVTLDCPAVRRLDGLLSLTLTQGRLQIREGERVLRELSPGDAW